MNNPKENPGVGKRIFLKMQKKKRQQKNAEKESVFRLNFFLGDKKEKKTKKRLGGQKKGEKNGGRDANGISRTNKRNENDDLICFVYLFRHCPS